jgi:hypothetical protein
MDKLVFEIHSSNLQPALMYKTAKSKKILEQYFVKLGTQGYTKQATHNIK